MKFFKSFLKMIQNEHGFAALTPTKVTATELAGDQKIYICSFTPASASDTITFVAATHKFRKIYGAFPHLTAGIDSALLQISATFSGLVVTVLTYDQAGGVATDWTAAAAVMLLVVGSAD